MATAQPHVYFNLHRSCWSIMLRGKVTGHGAALIVYGARFVVREGGRQRVLREGRKNVHAFVVGDVEAAAEGMPAAMFAEGTSWVEVTYRPTNGPSFTIKATGEPVREAEAVYMSANRKLYAYRAR